MNPAFFYILFLAMKFNNFGFWMSFIIVLKFADISVRLNIMNKIDKKEDISQLVPFDVQMNIYFRYMNLIIYIPAFLFAFFI